MGGIDRQHIQGDRVCPGHILIIPQLSDSVKAFSCQYEKISGPAWQVRLLRAWESALAPVRNVTGGGIFWCRPLFCPAMQKDDSDNKILFVNQVFPAAVQSVSVAGADQIGPDLLCLRYLIGFFHDSVNKPVLWLKTDSADQLDETQPGGRIPEICSFGSIAYERVMPGILYQTSTGRIRRKGEKTSGRRPKGLPSLFIFFLLFLVFFAKST